jgi:hypothetical protein
MSERLNPDLARMMGKKWVACFDILGFSKLTKSSLVSAFCQVERCVLEARQKSPFHQKLGHAWFSDTFLFYAEDDSEGSFDAIEFVSTNFFEMLLLLNIPLRGAMACDETNRIFIGKALVDAFHFGEKCNWVGFVLCPSAVCQIEKLNIPATRSTYSRFKLWDVPTKQNLCVFHLHRTFRTRALLCGARFGNGSQFMRELKAMSERTASPKDKVKYANSIQFLNHFSIPK